ncbi:uncharacterized protein LOC133883302 [Phragmites australis]|uniref:uncharacterized protein LOC133883302 n=1 Tax=Phragmites australis TaxID=29695 RepID=UPI002D789C7E|nr:uncharacterized protein LOC133883302 [Phragmites australis]
MVLIRAEQDASNIGGHASEHIDELKRSNPQNVQRRHKDQFVEWFEREITKLHEEGKVNDLIYALSKGPDHWARVYNRCFINGFLFRTARKENNLSTQNSGVVVKGDDTTGNIDWYGVITKIMSLDFAMGKEVVLFQCDWYDVPTVNRNQGRGYKKDQYGIIDVETTQRRYIYDPYILGIQAEQVFYVKDVKKPNWSIVIRMKPRNLFAIPLLSDRDNEVEIDLDSLVVGVQDMNVAHTHDNITHWSRADMARVSGDAFVIEKAQADVQSRNEQSDSEIDDDDTHIDETVMLLGIHYIKNLMMNSLCRF